MKKKKDKEGEDKEEESITETFLGGIPILGGFFKELGKTGAFQERFREVDEKIRENLKKGERKRWEFEANLSIRPLIKEIKKETCSEISMHEDYFYGKKGDKLILAIKVPQEGVDCEIKGNNLLIKADNFEKKIELPGYFKEIKKKQYNKKFLVLELIK